MPNPAEDSLTNDTNQMDSPLASWIKQPLTNNQEPPIKRTHFHATKVNCRQNIQANRMN
jgi:hypothetical protein